MTTEFDGDVDEQAQNQQLAARMADVSVTVAATWGEHVETFEETLATVLLGEVGDWYTDSVAEDADNRAERDAVAGVLTDAFQRGSDYLQNVIATGFLEALPGTESPTRWVVEQLPGPLRQELSAMEHAEREGR